MTTPLLSTNGSQKILPMMILFATLAIFTIAAASSGCVALESPDFLNQDQSGGIPPPCSGTNDCIEGRICIESVCVADRVPDLPVVLRVTPPPGRGLKWQLFTNLQIGRNSSMPDLVLQPTVTLEGRIVSEHNPLANSIPARIVATMVTQTPSNAPQWSAEARAEEGRGFSLALLPGEYNLAIFPESNLLPPSREYNVKVDKNIQRLFKLPSLKDYKIVTGRCVLIDEPDSEGIPEIRVQAFSENQANLSTVTQTAYDGQFQLYLPPGSGNYTLRFSPTDSNPFYPTVDIADITVEEEAQIVDLDQIALGTGGNPMVVNGRVVDLDGNPVSNVVLEFEGKQGNGVFFRNTTTDMDGNYLVNLLPGEYEVRLTPPLESSHALSFPEKLTVQLDNQVVDDYTLEPKQAFTGRVVDPSTMIPVAGVTMEAVLTVAGDASVYGVMRSALTVSDSSGLFTLLLDEGLYHLTMIPPISSGLPRWTEQNITLPPAPDADHQVGDGVFTLELKEPAVAYGTIYGPDAVDKIAGCVVEVFKGGTMPSAATNPGVHGKANQSSSVLLGSAITDKNGRYTILLPNP